jgi:hypothetical protein
MCLSGRPSVAASPAFSMQEKPRVKLVKDFRALDTKRDADADVQVRGHEVLTAFWLGRRSHRSRCQAVLLVNIIR